MNDSNKIILAFDPGNHCGVAKKDRNQYTAWIIGGEEAIDVLVATRRSLRLDAVVIEDFTGGGFKDHYARYTTLLVGRLMGACDALGVRCVVHTSQAKDPCLAQAEVILGKKHTKHASDDVAALAHLLAYEERRKK